MHHLFNHEAFATKFRKIVEGRFKRYGHFEYDTEGEIIRYKVYTNLSLSIYNYLLHKGLTLESSETR